MAFANAVAGPTTDGILYCSNKILPAAEADLYNASTPDPIPLPYEVAIVASVELVVSGNPGSNSSYVVLQTDLGDGVWYDLAWCLLTSVNNGAANFLLAAGVGGANSFQQTRTVGTAPAGNGSNQCPLGARVRFVGKSSLGSGSSSSSSSSGSPGNPLQVTAKIVYKIVGLR
jgi:hypothetical protein